MTDDKDTTDCDSDESSKASSTVSDDSDYEYEIEKKNTRRRRIYRRTQNAIASRRIGNPRYVGDVKEEDLENPRKVKKVCVLAKQQIIEQRAKLENIEQRNKRLEGQVTRLKNVIKHLKSQHVCTNQNKC